MKKGYFVLIIIAAIILTIATVFSPLTMIFCGVMYDIINGTNAEIEIDSYRLCQDSDGEDVIIIRYLLKNKGKKPTALDYEGDFYVYQGGVSLTEYYEEDGKKLPKECNYDSEDRYKNIKGGVEYYAEIAYCLESPDKDVVVEVEDYGLFGKEKEKTFKLK